MSEDGAAEVVASESVDVAPVESAPDVAVDAAVEPVEDTPAVIDWNGELDSLRDADWMSNIDDSMRDRLLRGIERKFRNFERGYTTSYQENAKARRTNEARSEEIKQEEIRLQRWLSGDVDVLVEKQSEIEKLRIGNQAALGALKQDHETALQKLQNEHASSIEETISLREELEEKLQIFEREEAGRQAEAARVQHELDEQNLNDHESWIVQNAPDLIDGNDPAFRELCVFLAGGIERDRALKMLRAEHPDPRAVVVPDPEPQPEQPPAAVDLMNMGTSQSAGTTTGEPRGIDEILDTLRRQAQGGIFGQ